MDNLISCVMPTMRGRERLAELAIECWARQDHAARELVIVLDEGMPVPRLPAGCCVVGPDANVRLVETPGLATIGEKFNAGIDTAAGEIIALWADDDWQAHWRLSAQVRMLRDDQVDVVGCDRMLYLDLVELRAARYWYVPGVVTNAYLVGGTMAFRRRFWAARPFDASSSGEDNRFVQGRMGGSNAATMFNERSYVAMRHGRNTGQVPTALWGTHPQWEAVDVGVVEGIVGAAELDRWRRAATK